VATPDEALSQGEQKPALTIYHLGQQVSKPLKFSRLSAGIAPCGSL
jgi:hypothetical protein